jgi:toxin CcdB
MAQFDVYMGAKGKGYLLDCQSELLSDLSSRIVIPLLPASGVPAATRLNPIFDIEEKSFVMSTHLLFAIPNARLTSLVRNIAHQRGAIISAIDILWSGI